MAETRQELGAKPRAGCGPEHRGRPDAHGMSCHIVLPVSVGDSALIESPRHRTVIVEPVPKEPWSISKSSGSR